MHLFPPKDKFVATRAVTWWALVFFLLTLVGPLFQQRSPMGIYTVSRLWPAAGPGSALLALGLFGALLTAVWSTYFIRLDNLRHLAHGAMAAFTLLFAIQVYGLWVWGSLEPDVLVSVYFKKSGASLGWAWLTLAVAVVSIKLAADWGAKCPPDSLPEPGWPEWLTRLKPRRPKSLIPAPVLAMPGTTAAQVIAPPKVAQPTSSPPASLPPISMAASATKTPKDIGHCLNCHVANSKHAKRCHSCGAILPWAQPKVSPTSQPGVNGSKAAAVPPVALPKLDGEFGTKVLGFGGHLLCFGFCSSFPLLGFFLWRYLDGQESRYSGTALWGWMAGILGIILMVVVRVLTVLGGSG